MAAAAGAGSLRARGAGLGVRPGAKRRVGARRTTRSNARANECRICTSITGKTVRGMHARMHELKPPLCVCVCFSLSLKLPVNLYLGWFYSRLSTAILIGCSLASKVDEVFHQVDEAVAQDVDVLELRLDYLAGSTEVRTLLFFPKNKCKKQRESGKEIAI